MVFFYTSLPSGIVHAKKQISSKRPAMAPSGVETTSTQPATTQTTEPGSEVLDAIENAIIEKLNEEGEYYI